MSVVESEDVKAVSAGVQRDAPHVMGLGYIARLARETEDELARRRDIALQHLHVELAAVEHRRLQQDQEQHERPHRCQ